MAGSTELIAALDVDTAEEALKWAKLLEQCRYVKIGSQLFTRHGPHIVSEIHDLGKRIFLDLKFHDIPNTVAKAAQAAAALGAHLITVHACGGRRMIEAARRAVDGSATAILAVTVLTSLSDDMLREEVGLRETAAEAVQRYAKLAIESGAHGVVCSPEEIVLVRQAVGWEPLVATPGVRPTWSTKNDQVRTMTPRDAREAGANFVVIGRPIFKHPEPAEAVRLILEELQGM